MPRSRIPGPRPTRGMTLVELLVAFMVFVMLISALVSLTTTSLDTWARGEARKDIYDRAQIVLGALAEDLTNLYSENEIYDDGKKELHPPALACDADAHRRPRLRFVRTGSPRQVRGTRPSGVTTIVAPMYYGDFWEVAYLMDHDPAKNVLWRGVRWFDRRTEGTLLRPADTDAASDPLFKAAFRPLETGVLHVEFKFWTQFTTTWDEKARIQKLAPNSKQQSGPETRWDSTRRTIRPFHFHRPKADRGNPDFVYPEIVQVTVVLESSVSSEQGARLAEPCDAKASILKLNDTSRLPDAPGMAKIGGEWVEYADKTLHELMSVRRGQRGSVAAEHAAGAVVRSGETFSTDVPIAAYREAQEP